MSERDWREDAISVVGVLALLGVVGWIALDWTELQTRQRVIEQYSESAQANYSDEEIEKLCESRLEESRIKCAIDAVSAREKQSQDTRDLHAQEWMAHWAKWMFWAAALGSAAALFGLWLLRLTWRETKRTADVAWDVGTDQARAYVQADRAFFFWGGATMDQPRVEVWFINCGQTPVRTYRARTIGLIYRHTEGPKPDIPTVSESGIDGSQFLGPWSGMQPGGSGRKVIFHLEAHKDELVSARQTPFGYQGHGFVVVGEIEYETFFGERFVSQYCFGRTEGLPRYRLKETVTTEYEGFTIRTDLEEPIPLARVSTDIKVYERKR